MKIIISLFGLFISLVIALLFSTFSFANSWCQWSGTEAINCQSDSIGYILINGFKVRSPSIANIKGWYKLTQTMPIIGSNQIIDNKIWGFSNNEISLTWSVRDMTTEEINNKEAAAMEIGQYYLWKTLIEKGVITQQEAATNLPQELIDAYLARKELQQ